MVSSGFFPFHCSLSLITHRPKIKWAGVVGHLRQPFPTNPLTKSHQKQLHQITIPRKRGGKASPCTHPVPVHITIIQANRINTGHNGQEETLLIQPLSMADYATCVLWVNQGQTSPCTPITAKYYTIGS